MGDAFFSNHWRRTRRDRIIARIERKVCVRKVMERIQVSVPYSDVFRLEAHKLGARWRPRSEVWSFPRSKSRELYDLIAKVYGPLAYVKGDEND